MNKLFKIFNIQNLDTNQKWIASSILLGGFLLTYVSPTIVKEIYSELPARWIAFESLFGAFAGLIISMLWKGAIRKNAMKRFLYLIGAETIAGIVLCIYLTCIEYNVWVLAITSLIYTAFITIFIGKCIMVFKTKLWNNKEREEYDNNMSIIYQIVCILGYMASLLYLPSLQTSLILWGVAYFVDNIGWSMVYYRNKKQLENDTQEVCES